MPVSRQSYERQSVHDPRYRFCNDANVCREVVDLRAEVEWLREEGRKMYESFVAERRMLREALIEHGETDAQLAERYRGLNA